MRPIDYSSHLTPDERLSEVASILAIGILRLRARAALSGQEGQGLAAENSPESGPPCLEVPDETVLSVHNG